MITNTLITSLACLDTQSLTSLGTLTTACSSSPSPALPTMDLIQVMIIMMVMVMVIMMTAMLMTMVEVGSVTDEPQIVTICPKHLLALTTRALHMMMMATRSVTD